MALERPITVEEINQVLKESAPGKSPGPDRFRTPYLKKNLGNIVPKIMYIL